MIADLARTQRDLLKLDDAIDFIFDDQIDKKHRLIAAWDSFKKMGHPTFKHLMGDTPAFRDDKNVLPLQAADLHAWLVRKRWDDYATGQPETRMPWTKQRKIPSIAIEWGEEQLRTVHSMLFEEEIPNWALFELGVTRDLLGRMRRFGGHDLP